MNKQDLSELRRNYSKSSLSENSVSREPFEQFARWMQDAVQAQIPDANAMNLATVGSDSRPSSRVVLLKGFSNEGFVFYTNYGSRKAGDLESNPFAAIHFYWAELERQINISGRAARVPREESEEYFRSRPFESRIGAWASQQSRPIASRDELETAFAELSARHADGDVPLPPFWGGYRIVPDRFEFWQGRESRLHDRICYTLAAGEWQITRLSP